MFDDFVGGPRQKLPRRKSKLIRPGTSGQPAPVVFSPQQNTSPSTNDGLNWRQEVPASPEPAFRTPEVIAADTPRPTTDQIEKTLGATAIVDGPTETNRWKQFLRWHWPHSRKITAIVITVAVLLIGGGSAAAYLNQPKGQSDVHTSKRPAYTPPKPKPKVIYSSLTGLPVADESVNQRPVTGVMIENSLDARPQSGLDQAGVVFEAIAEGGITRFLALFQDTQPDYLGPVRSARPYYVQWCMGFDCSLAHVGGSPEALQNIKQWGTKDLDQFANSGSYHRISSRYAPHNVYTSVAELNALESSKGFGASSYTGFTRKDDPKTKPAATATSIDFAISGAYYNAHFDYDAATDSYKRSEAGGPHMELHKDGSQVQITPKVVVALAMQYGLEADDHHSYYNVIGTGQAYVFQDGTVTTATWSKADSKGALTFTGADGKPLALNRGQTWITALQGLNQATYK